MRTPLQTLTDLFLNRETYQLDWGDFFAENKAYIWGGLLIYVVVMLARSWENFSQPGFYAEDSLHYFNYYYGNTRSFVDIFQAPNGYYNIYNNLMAWLIAKADILFQPFCYQLAAISLAVLTVAAFSLSGLIRSKYILIMSPLLLGFSGLNHIYYYISLTFQMYVIIVFLMVLLFWQKSSVSLFNLLYFLLACFMIWSGPYSVLIVPFCLTFIVLFKGKNFLFSGLLLISITYVFSVSKSTIMFENLFDSNITGMWGKSLVLHIFYMNLQDSINMERLLLIPATIIPLLIYLRKEKYYLKTTLLFAVVIISSLAPFFLSEKYLLYQTIYPCHIMIAQFFWLAFVLYSLDMILLKMKRFQSTAGIALMLGITSFIVYDNYSHIEKFKVPVLSSTKAFVKTVKEVEQMGLKERGQWMVITTDGTDGFRVEALVGARSKKQAPIKRIHVE